MSEVFEISGVNEAIQNIGDGTCARIEVRVKGYWSSVITVYLNREWSNTDNITITMSHSSGGRDTKQIECDLEAEINFGTAIVEVARFMQNFMANFGDRISEIRTAAQARRRACAEAEKTAFENDREVGDIQAKIAVDYAMKMASHNPGREIKLLARGNHVNSGTLRFDFNQRAAARFVTPFGNVMKITRNEAIAKLARASHVSIA